MTRSAKICLFIFVAVAGIAGTVSQVVAARPDTGVLYLNAERTSFALISERGAKFGIYNIEDVAGTVPEPSIGAPAADCSDQQYRCVRFGFKGFAVPRNGLFDKSKYWAGGIQYKVLLCYRHARNGCVVALIQGDCQMKDVNGFCRAGATGRKNNPGPVTYFIYNRRFGVVAFGSSSDPVGPIAAEQAARVNLLQGNIGVLHD
jgi:hypothetical protein